MNKFIVIVGLIGSVVIGCDGAQAMNYGSVVKHMTFQQAYAMNCTDDGGKKVFSEYNEMLERVRNNLGPTAANDAMSESLLGGAVMSRNVEERGNKEKFCEETSKYFELMKL